MVESKVGSPCPVKREGRAKKQESQISGDSSEPWISMDLKLELSLNIFFNVNNEF